MEWMIGTLASAWEVADDHSAFSIAVKVPAQSIANVTVPLLDFSAFEITEAGSPVWRNGRFVPGVPGVLGAKATNENIVFTVASGNYNFTIINGKSSVMISGEAGEHQTLQLSCPTPNQACTPFF